VASWSKSGSSNVRLHFCSSQALKEMAISILNEIKDLPSKVIDPN
jgi:hypothetical protein